MAPLFIQLLAVLLLQQLAVAGNAAQRRPQIVRDGVGEGFELAVELGQPLGAPGHPPLELFVAAPELRFGVLERCDVEQDASDVRGRPRGVTHNAGAVVDPDPAAVGAAQPVLLPKLIRTVGDAMFEFGRHARQVIRVHQIAKVAHLLHQQLRRVAPLPCRQTQKFDRATRRVFPLDQHHRRVVELIFDLLQLRLPGLQAFGHAVDRGANVGQIVAPLEADPGLQPPGTHGRQRAGNVLHAPKPQQMQPEPDHGGKREQQQGLLPDRLAQAGIAQGQRCAQIDLHQQLLATVDWRHPEQAVSAGQTADLYGRARAAFGL